MRTFEARQSRLQSRPAADQCQARSVKEAGPISGLTGVLKLGGLGATRGEHAAGRNVHHRDRSRFADWQNHPPWQLQPLQPLVGLLKMPWYLPQG